MQLPVLEAALRIVPTELREIDKIQKYRVDNIAQWYIDIGQNNVPAVGEFQAFGPEEMLKNFPNIAPVADYMWFEYTGREGWRGEACMIVSQPTDRPIVMEHEAKWLYILTILRLAKSGLVYKNTLDLCIYVGPTGEYVCSGMDKKASARYGLENVKGTIIEREGMIALATLAFLHCKNISTLEVRPSRQTIRDATRHNRPILHYKTLVLDTPSGSGPNDAPPGAGSGSGGSKSLHIVRGHFAKYTSAAPLFGKHVGIFYHPMHRRGSLAVGRIVKDYDVKPKVDHP